MNKHRIQRPVFMIGMPRSGTTVLAEAVAMHEDFGWISNYINLLPKLTWLALFDRVADNPLTGNFLRGRKKQDLLWSSSFRRILPRPDEAWEFWRSFCGNRFLRHFPEEWESNEIDKDRLFKTLSTILRCQGKKRLFTKLTGPPRIRYFNAIFPDACFVHVLRDPRSTVASLLRVPFWRQGGGLEAPWWHNGLPKRYLAEWEASDCSPVVLAAVQWKRVVELTWEEKKKIAPRRFVEVRYESFVDDPHSVLSRIFSVFGLPESERAHRYLDVSYRTNIDLRPDEIKLVEKVTGETAAAAGYIF